MKYLLIVLTILVSLQLSTAHAKKKDITDMFNQQSLANEQLIADATQACHIIIKAKNLEMDLQKPPQVMILAKPKGRKGKKKWQELWVFNAGGSPSVSFIVNFQEAGKQNATYEVHLNKIRGL